jgi:hypothetical protein
MGKIGKVLCDRENCFQRRLASHCRIVDKLVGLRLNFEDGMNKIQIAVEH